MYESLSSLTDADLLLSPPSTPRRTTTTTSTTAGTTTAIENVEISNATTTLSFNYYNLGPYIPTSTIRTSSVTYESLSKPPSVTRPSVSLSSSSSSNSASPTIPNEETGGTISSGLVPLPYDFVPGPYDVICGRGKVVSEHEGNVRFRTIIESRLEEYKNAICKLDKSLIVSSIIDTITNERPHGGFIKHVNNRWYQVDNHFAREKCGQSFRDLLHNTYKSSTKSKAGRRKEGSKSSTTGSLRPINDDRIAATSVVAPNHPKESRTNGTPSTNYSTNATIVGTATTSISTSMSTPQLFSAMKVIPVVARENTTTVNAPRKQKELSIDDTVLESKRRSFEQTVHKLMKGAFIPTPNRPTLSVPRATSESLCGTSCRCGEGA